MKNMHFNVDIDGFFIKHDVDSDVSDFNIELPLLNFEGRLSESLFSDYRPPGLSVGSGRS